MSGPPSTHRFRLHPPEVVGQEVVFGWEVTPPTELYRANGFRLTFPPELDITVIPPGLWLRLAMLCLHVHWALLRPCRIELPFYLGPAERGFWLRMIDTATYQLEVCGGQQRPGRAAELLDEGPALPPTPIATNADRAAAAFSGGKDSLVQAGLLAELTDRPLLVTTTSPVEWARDQTGAARARTLGTIESRLPVELMEVHSDFRACWDNAFATHEGSVMSVNELTDVLLYQATTIAVAAASGISRSFMASEADLQYNAPRDGEVVQHSHFTSSAATLGAVDQLLRQFGLRLGTLTHALHMPQVMSLLWRRYPRLTDLQFSCWSAAEGAQACSTCGQCYEVAMAILAEGHSPTAAGIDPVALLRAWAAPRPQDPRRAHLPALHPVRRPRDKTAQMIQAMTAEQVAEILRADSVAAGDPDLPDALAGYERLRERALGHECPRPPGYIGEFLETVDADLRDRLRLIFDQYFEASEEGELARMYRRSQSLSRWIADPLVRRRDSRPTWALPGRSGGHVGSVAEAR